MGGSVSTRPVGVLIDSLLPVVFVISSDFPPIKPTPRQNAQRPPHHRPKRGGNYSLNPCYANKCPIISSHGVRVLMLPLSL